MPDYHEWQKVKQHAFVEVRFGLHIYSGCIDAHVGGCQPVFTTHHFEQSKHGREYIVKVTMRQDPISPEIDAVVLIFHLTDTDLGRYRLFTEKVSATEQVDTY